MFEFLRKKAGNILPEHNFILTRVTRKEKIFSSSAGQAPTYGYGIEQKWESSDQWQGLVAYLQIPIYAPISKFLSRGMTHIL